MYCTLLPFRRWWSVYTREHFGASGGVWRSECLAQGGYIMEDPHSSRYVLKCSNEWSLCWLCFEFWPSCTILLVVECCRLAQCICSVILCIFCDVTDCDPRTSVRLVLWLHCIFACLEIDILYTLAFSQKMELLYSRAHQCQRLIWKLTVLGSGCLEDLQSCSTHETNMFWKSGTRWRN